MEYQLIKIGQSEAFEVYNLLKELKYNEWIIDKRNILIINKIINFHFLITNMISAYDGLDSDIQLSYMVADLARYFKQDIKIVPKKKCKKCKRIFPVEEFLSKTTCRSCI